LVKNQAQVGNQKSVLKGVVELFQTAKLSHIYRGLSTLMLREIPFSCIQLPLYQALKERIIKRRKDQSPPDPNLTMIEAAITGFMAGGTAAFLTNPNDVLKSNFMGENRAEKAVKLNGVFQSARHLLQKHGWTVFWRGAVLRSLHVGLMSISFFLWYEFANRFWKRSLAIRH
jgi:solute carrier family 25 S-adenosylmethionine transporter 26